MADTPPNITTSVFRDDGRAVYADGALLGWYWPAEVPTKWQDTARADSLCEPGIHSTHPIHAAPLFSTKPATHHATPAEAVEELKRAREHPNAEQVEVYDYVRHIDAGIPSAVRYARDLLERRRQR